MDREVVLCDEFVKTGMPLIKRLIMGRVINVDDFRAVESTMV